MKIVCPNNYLMLSLITLLLMHLKCDSDLLCHAVCSLYHLIRKRACSIQCRYGCVYMCIWMVLGMGWYLGSLCRYTKWFTSDPWVKTKKPNLGLSPFLWGIIAKTKLCL